VISDWWLLVTRSALVVDDRIRINHEPLITNHCPLAMLHRGETDRNRREDVAFSGWYLYLQQS
jgi:hypothetical protein